MFGIHKTPALQRRNQYRKCIVFSRNINISPQIHHIGRKRLCITCRVLTFLIIVSKLYKQKISFSNLCINYIQTPFVNKALRAPAIFSMIDNRNTLPCIEWKHLSNTRLRICRNLICLNSRIRCPINFSYSTFHIWFPPY